MSARDVMATAGPARISVPLSYTDELYSLRSHIALVRERLSQAQQSQ